jgi:hypothetical protein
LLLERILIAADEVPEDGYGTIIMFDPVFLKVRFSFGV